MKGKVSSWLKPTPFYTDRGGEPGCVIRLQELQEADDADRIRNRKRAANAHGEIHEGDHGDQPGVTEKIGERNYLCGGILT